ncbi:hypothetical protein KKF91_02435 [Myxococcota bacterium]|nr:hypothetical protein [Myxococcota bacterium]MBU1429397.1 hypothetical protein [Myxococcota bacterium]MBU1900234.1 hypothetical protein [Myxococcota bacterium]
MRVYLISLSLLVGLTSGCGDIAEYLSGPRQLGDEDFFRFARQDRQSAPPTDVQAVQAVVDHEVAVAQGDAPPALDEDAQAMLRRTVQARLQIDEEGFERVDFFEEGLSEPAFAQKKACALDFDPAALQHKDYMIPNVDKIPVRDQGGRGTCAAFAGIGSLEYNTLATIAPKLPTLNLSEQRFYWMSKSECQGPSGCECPGCSEGSWYGAGFNASSGGDLDIPLETDCPYNPQQGKNDTQYPQRGSCQEGAVGVSGVQEWCGLDDLVDLLERGYAVPYASPLSSNWEMNDGLITLRDLRAMGETIHAGGHAYLIVGYKRLPNMPDEGGMCFYIKNSWGKGWGVNGYSCMTVAWMKEVTYDGFLSWPQPVVTQMEIRDDLRDKLPPDNEEAEDESAPDVPDDGDDGAKIPPEPAPEPEPAPPLDSEYEETRIYGPNESYYKVEAAPRDGELWVRGILRSGDDRSEPVRVMREGDKLIYDGDEVGAVEEGRIKLCTAEWASMCSLRFRAKDSRMYIQFRDDDLRAVKPEEVNKKQGQWLGLPVLGDTYQIFIPSTDDPSFLLDPKTYIKINDEPALRFSLRAEKALSTNFELLLMGQPVGVLKLLDPKSSALCSGDYASECQLLGKSKLNVIPRNRRRVKLARRALESLGGAL